MRTGQRLRSVILTALALAIITTTMSDAFAQRKRTRKKKKSNIASLGERRGTPKRVNWKVGIVVQAFADCGGIYGTAQVPNVWPEQEVKIVKETSSRQVRRIRYRFGKSNTKQMMIVIPRLGAGQVAQTLITFEVTKYSILAPQDPSLYLIAKSPPSLIKTYLGPSPKIESRNTKIRAQAKELLENKQQTDWKQVEVIYDWVRDNVKYRNGGKLKGGLAALRDKYGDYEDLTSLFIALCRASKVPARTVWVPNFCYAEFYLEDEKKKGYWFPCLVAGPRHFGEMNDHRPILQKGDNIKVPEKKKPQRYLAEHVRVRGFGKPRVRFVRQQLPAGK